MLARDDHERRVESHRRPLRRMYLVVAVGELARVALLAALVSDRLYTEANAYAGVAAWLVLLLSPHAAVAAGLWILAAGRRPQSALRRLILAAKVLSVLSELVAIISETVSASDGAIRLAFLDRSVPDRIILVSLYTWDMAVLVTLILDSLRSRTPRAASGAPEQVPTAPANPEGPTLEVDDLAPTPPGRELV